MLAETNIAVLHPWQVTAKDTVPIDEKKREGAALKRLWDTRHTMTQAAFATEVLGVSEGYLPQFFRGIRPLTLAYARIFAERLKCSIKEFSPRLATQDADERVTVRWPFDTVEYSAIAALEPWDLAELEGVIRAFLIRQAASVSAPPRRLSKKS